MRIVCGDVSSARASGASCSAGGRWTCYRDRHEARRRLVAVGVAGDGGPHPAVARDAAGNKTTAAARTVTVNNVASAPTSGSLRWPAPTLTSPQTILIPERGGEQWMLEAGKDYVIKFQTGRHYGPMRFSGGRNLVFVGGEQIIDDTTSTDYGKRRVLEFRDQTGTIHIEGYLGRGPGLTEGINIWAPNAILQIQKSRFENLHKMSNNSAQHPDLIQTWSGPKRSGSGASRATPTTRASCS